MTFEAVSEHSPPASVYLLFFVSPARHTLGPIYRRRMPVILPSGTLVRLQLVIGDGNIWQRAAVGTSMAACTFWHLSYCHLIWRVTTHFANCIETRAPFQNLKVCSQWSGSGC